MPEHRCKRLFLIDYRCEEEEESEEYDELIAKTKIPKISLHAIIRVQAPEAMHVSAEIKR